MAAIKVERVAICTALVVSCLQLLATVKAKPLPAECAGEADYNATTWKNQTIPNSNVNCQCDSTNLTMTVDGNFLYKWCSSFNSDHHHSIRDLSEAVGDLVKDSEGHEASIYNRICSMQYKS